MGTKIYTTLEGHEEWDQISYVFWSTQIGWVDLEAALENLSSIHELEQSIAYYDSKLY